MQEPPIDGVVGIHHVAFAVADLDAAVELWTTTLGAHVELRAVVADQGVEAASLQWPGRDALLELVAPAPGADPATNGMHRFLERRGAGMHHVAWAVRDVAGALDALRARGARLVDAVPRIGLHGVPVGFVHPSAMGGVLVELVEQR